MEEICGRFLSPNPEVDQWSQGSQSTVLITKWHKHPEPCLACPSRANPVLRKHLSSLKTVSSYLGMLWLRESPGTPERVSGYHQGTFFNPSWQRAAVYLEEPVVVVHSQDFLAKLKVPAQILPNYQLLPSLPPLKLSSRTSVIGKPHRKAQSQVRHEACLQRV